eukprot:gene30245-39456_t
MTYAWLVSLILVFVVFIVAAVAASKSASSDTSGENNMVSDAPAASFTGVWTALVLIVIAIVGTVIMRRYQTSMAIGFLLGLVFIMTQQMLILFAIFVERSQIPNETKTFTGSQQAMAIFAWFLFLIYAAFGLMLAVFRDDVIKEELPSSDGIAQSNDFAEQGGSPQYDDDAQE